MNIPMLKKVRAAILKRPRQFEMDSYFTEYLTLANDSTKQPSHCGTAACIAGWAAHLQTGNKRLSQTNSELPSDIWSYARSILAIDAAQAERLFYETHWPDKFYDRYAAADATVTSRAKAAAARINHFIKTKGRE